MKTIKFPNQADIDYDASAWIAKIDRGLSDEEKVELNGWLEISSLHGEALIKLASMWDLLDTLHPISKLLPVSDVDFNSSTDVDTQNRPDSRYSAGKLAVAASILVTIGALGTWFWLHSNPKVPVSLAEIRTEPSESTRVIRHYQTAIGETTTFTLTDGSVMQLNTDSTATIDYTANRRQVELTKGEVFFEVAHNPTRPFIVASGDNRVTAVGTAFSVDVSSDQTMEVIVTEGKVLINKEVKPLNPIKPYADVLATPGQRVVVQDNQPDVLTEHDPDATLAWREGFVVFEGEPLAEVVREIDRYTPLTFNITDPELAEIPVGGYFKTGDLEQLLLVLRQNFGVVSERSGNEVLLSKLTR
ncbi:MAG: FecR family protein [Gammaproteobacteria bacterium]